MRIIHNRNPDDPEASPAAPPPTRHHGHNCLGYEA